MALFTPQTLMLAVAAMEATLHGAVRPYFVIDIGIVPHGPIPFLIRGISLNSWKAKRIHKPNQDGFNQGGM